MEAAWPISSHHPLVPAGDFQALACCRMSLRPTGRVSRDPGKHRLPACFLVSPQNSVRRGLRDPNCGEDQKLGFSEGNKKKQTGIPEIPTSRYLLEHSKEKKTPN